MGIDFYYSIMSGPCRSILMTAEYLGIKLNLKPMDLMGAKDHLKPEFLAINPQHTIPTMVDNGFTLWESRAVLEYLVQKYGNGKLYPKELEKRVLVSQRLYFDMGTLYERWIAYWRPQWMSKETGDPEKLKKIEEAVEFLNTFLNGNDWVVGDQVTIADIALGVTVSNIEIMGFDLSPYKNVKSWFMRVKRLPGYERNEEGAQAFKKVIGNFMLAKQ